MNFLDSFPLFIRRSVVEEIGNFPNLKPSKRIRVSGVEKSPVLSSLSFSRYSLYCTTLHWKKHGITKTESHFMINVSFSSSLQKQPLEHAISKVIIIWNRETEAELCSPFI